MQVDDKAEECGSLVGPEPRSGPGIDDFDRLPGAVVVGRRNCAVAAHPDRFNPRVPCGYAVGKNGDARSRRDAG